MAKRKQHQHLTDYGSDAMREAGDAIDDATGSDANQVAGPSPNPATNAIIHEIVLRSVGRLARQTVEKGLLQRRYGRDLAAKAIENRSLVHTLATYGVTKFATRSVPGALTVGGALLAKTLWDRSQSKRSARRSGDKMLKTQARYDSAL